MLPPGVCACELGSLPASTWHGLPAAGRSKVAVGGSTPSAATTGAWPSCGGCAGCCACRSSCGAYARAGGWSCFAPGDGRWTAAGVCGMSSQRGAPTGDLVRASLGPPSPAGVWYGVPGGVWYGVPALAAAGVAPGVVPGVAPPPPLAAEAGVARRRSTAATASRGGTGYPLVAAGPGGPAPEASSAMAMVSIPVCSPRLKSGTGTFCGPPEARLQRLSRLNSASPHSTGFRQRWSMFTRNLSVLLPRSESRPQRNRSFHLGWKLPFLQVSVLPTTFSLPSV
mmetsp:Transcript_109054/g.326175  ORF Transcript_109054/g.326175 Transcript_109054/m.326175 type:complete len:282 (+) Transcript_109054:101-946(+)